MDLARVKKYLSRHKQIKLQDILPCGCIITSHYDSYDGWYTVNNYCCNTHVNRKQRLEKMLQEAELKYETLKANLEDQVTSLEEEVFNQKPVPRTIYQGSFEWERLENPVQERSSKKRKRRGSV